MQASRLRYAPEDVSLGDDGIAMDNVSFILKRELGFYLRSSASIGGSNHAALILPPLAATRPGTREART